MSAIAIPTSAAAVTAAISMAGGASRSPEPSDALAGDLHAQSRMLSAMSARANAARRSSGSSASARPILSLRGTVSRG